MFHLGYHDSFELFLVPLYCICAFGGCVATVHVPGFLHIICVCGGSVATDVTEYLHSNCVW